MIPISVYTHIYLHSANIYLLSDMCGNIKRENLQDLWMNMTTGQLTLFSTIFLHFTEIAEDQAARSRVLCASVMNKNVP